MLIELNKSHLTDELVAVNASIVALLRRMATDGVTSYEEATDGWRHPGKPSAGKVDAILKLPLADRQALADAVSADLAFESEVDTYDFAFFSLTEPVRKAGKELMGSLYEGVFSTDRFLLESGKEGGRIAWENAFRDANPDIKVCPACLAGFLETRIKSRSAVDLEHYLPKSLYPPLTIHGPNLVPLCSRCNSRAKVNADPLEGDNERRRLSSVWFPYADAGLNEAHLTFDMGGKSGHTVRLEGSGDGAERAENFDSLYLVSKLWSELLEGVHNALCTELAAREASAAAPLSVEQIDSELSVAQAGAAESRFTVPGSYLRESYCTWLRSDNRALQAFARAVQGFPPPQLATTP